MKKPPPAKSLFSKRTIDFLSKAGREDSIQWLEKHEEEFKSLIVEPMRELILLASQELRADARGYVFPRRFSPRLKLSSRKSEATGHELRTYVHVTVQRPSGSRFDLNPSLYFSFSPEHIFAGGGIYKPSSRQINKLREWFDTDASELEDLIKDRTFRKHFPRGLETEKSVKTKPRKYEVDHPRIELLKLQAYYVTRDYSRPEFYSTDFARMLIKDWKQALRFNEVISSYLAAWPENAPVRSVPTDVDESLADLDEEAPSPRGGLWDERL